MYNFPEVTVILGVSTMDQLKDNLHLQDARPGT